MRFNDLRHARLHRLMAASLLGAAAILSGCSSNIEQEPEEEDAVAVAPFSRAFGADTGGNVGIADISVNSAGEMAFTGSFSNTIDFGGGELDSTAEQNIFVAKLDANGKHVFSGRAGGGDDYARGVALNPDGDALLVGNFNGKVDLGTGTLEGYADLFLARFSATGAPLWSKGVGDISSSDSVSDLATNGKGTTYIAGNAGGMANFGEGPIAEGVWNTTYLARFDETSNTVLARTYLANSIYSDTLRIAADPTGGVVMLGSFYGELEFGDGPISKSDQSGIFVVKLDEEGDRVWSRVFQVPFDGNLYGGTLAVGPDGSVVIAGEFGSAIDLGGGPLTSEGWGNIFLVKLGPDGAHRFSKGFGDEYSNAFASAVAIDKDGYIILAGSLNGELDLGGGPLVSAGDTDVFVATFDPEGGHMKSSRFGDEKTQYAPLIAIDAGGNAVLGGTFYGSIDFGMGEIVAGDSPKLYLTRLP